MGLSELFEFKTLGNSNADLGICIEGIRRAIVYGRDLLKYRQHPRKIGKSTGRIATEGFVEALRAIAENCPLPEYKREDYLEKYRRLKESPWETIAQFGLSEGEIWSIIDTALDSLKLEVGYEAEKYERYIPR